MSVRTGARLGIDVGTVRIGVARSDFHAILATPLGTVTRGDEAIAEIVQMLCDIDAVEVIVGLPLSLSGARTASTQDAVDFATHLAHAITAPVRLVDERLSTVSAQQALHSTGRNTRTLSTLSARAESRLASSSSRTKDNDTWQTNPSGTTFSPRSLHPLTLSRLTRHNPAKKPEQLKTVVVHPTVVLHTVVLRPLGAKRRT